MVILIQQRADVKRPIVLKDHVPYSNSGDVGSTLNAPPTPGNNA
jgi:hypothetical protein